MKLKLSILFCLLSCLTFADDSAILKTFLESGGSTRLPKRDLILNQSVFVRNVPSGSVYDFGGRTIFIGCDKAIQLGESIPASSNWQLWPRAEVYAYQDLPEGHRMRLRRNRTYVVFDSHIVAAGTSDLFNHAEIVKNGDTVGRDYEGPVLVADVTDWVNSNVTFRNVIIDGGDKSENLTIGLFDGLKLEKIEWKNYRHLAATINLSRIVTISIVSVLHAPSAGIGTGYGIQVTRSRYISIDRSLLASAQALKFHSGSMDGEIKDCLAENGAYIDAGHGMGSKRIAVVRFTGGGGVVAGNSAWTEGDVGVTVRDSELSFLFVGQNAEATIRDSVIESPDSSPIVCEPGAALSMFRTRVSGLDRILNSSQNWEANATFEDCELIQTRPYWIQGNGCVIRLWSGSGSLTFRRSVFRSASFYEPLDFSGGLNIALQDCHFYTPGTDGATWLRGGFVGQFEASGNTLHTSDPLARFLWNFSATQGKVGVNWVGP